MQRIVPALLLGLAAANNIVNPATKKCLEADKAKKGSSLSMQACKDDDVQNFEIIGGRVRTILGDEELCIDIKAMCEDGTDVAGCTRQDITKLTEEAAIQLWKCRKDTAEGMNSSTYGNQKWDLLGNGYFKNVLTGLCLVAHHSGEEEGMVHVHTCPDETDKEFQLDFETGDMAAATNSAGDRLRLFSARPGLKAGSSSSTVVAAAAVAGGVLAMVAAAAAFVRSRRSEMVDGLPLTASD
jgi:hypothetical protein